MKLQNQLSAAQRFLAVLGATGTAALMTLPVLAQSPQNSNGVLNPNPSIFNEAPYNRSNSTTTETAQPIQPSVSDRCAGYTSGGVGGPVDSQSTQSNASTNRDQTRSSDDVAATGVQGSTNSNTPAQSSQMNSMGSTMNAPTAMNNMNSRMQSRMITRQFDGNNPSAAIAYRSNGPAGTAGHEAKMNLDAFQERQARMSSMQSSMQSNLSAAPLPTECAPR